MNSTEKIISWVFPYALFLFLCQSLTIGISLFSIELTSFLSWAIIIISALSSLLCRFYLRKRVKTTPQRDNPKGNPFFIILIVLCVVMVVLEVYIGYRIPELSWDGNTYHLPTVKFWETRGYIHWIDTDYLIRSVNGYPKGAESIIFLFSTAIHSYSFSNTINVLFIPLGVSGIILIASMLGVPFIYSILSGFLFVLVPININQSITTYVDSAYASCAIFSIAILLYAVFSQKNIFSAILPGVALSLAISVKSSGIGLAGICGIALILDAFRVWRKNRNLINFLIPITVLIIITIGGGYWYIRNYIHTGSPLYPVGLTISNFVIFPGYSTSRAISEKINTPEILRNLPMSLRVLYTWCQGFFEWPTSVRYYPDTRIGGLGFLWIIGCVPSVIYSLLAVKKSEKRWIFYVLTGIVSIDFLLTPMNWWARYSVWIYALGLPSFAFLLSHSLKNKSIQSGALKKLPTIFIIFMIILAAFEGTYSFLNILNMATHFSMDENVWNILDPQVWVWDRWSFTPELQNSKAADLLSQCEGIAVSPVFNGWNYYALIGEISQIPDTDLLVLKKSQSILAQIESQGLECLVWYNQTPRPDGIDRYFTDQFQGQEYSIYSGFREKTD
jgi:hypothetical protein